MKKTSRLNYGKKYQIVFCLTMFFFSFCFGSTGFAESARPCSDEIAKFCKDVRPGEGRILACLDEHEKDLSAACRKKFEEVKERLKEAQEACRKDIETFCKDVKPGGGRIAKCLRASESKLSPACRHVIMRTRGKRQQQNKDTEQ